LRIYKEQELNLILPEHDDDDDEITPVSDTTHPTHLTKHHKTNDDTIKSVTGILQMQHTKDYVYFQLRTAAF